jgi:hypothetical protein
MSRTLGSEGRLCPGLAPTNPNRFKDFTRLTRFLRCLNDWRPPPRVYWSIDGGRNASGRQDMDRLLILTVAVAAASAGPTQSPPPSPASGEHTSLSGRWRLNPEQSEDARQKVNEAMAGRQPGASGPGGGGSWGGHRGGSGYGGGHGGGRMGGGGPLGPRQTPRIPCAVSSKPRPT